MRTLLCLVGLFGGLALAGNAAAQTRSQVYGSSLDKQTQTAFLQGDIAMMTYESDTVASKETNELTTWTFGTYSGEARKLGVTFRSAQNSVPFVLNDSKMNTAWRDARLHARMWWFYPAIAAGLSEVKISQSGVETVDVFGASVGAGLGIYIPVWDRLVLHVDHMSYNTPNASDRNGRKVELGPRQDSEFGASFDVTDRMIDLVVGYRRRAYSLTIDDVANNEVEQGAFAGLRLGIYF